MFFATQVGVVAVPGVALVGSGNRAGPQPCHTGTAGPDTSEARAIVSAGAGRSDGRTTGGPQKENHKGARELPRISIQMEPRTPAQEKADTWLLDRARRAKNGQVFSRLYDELPGAGSQHENDFRLCMMLLYWTQDSNGIPDLSWADRLYRHSQRYVARFEKWDRRLGKYTYGQVTLYQAYLKRYIQF